MSRFPSEKQKQQTSGSPTTAGRFFEFEFRKALASVVILLVLGWTFAPLHKLYKNAAHKSVLELDDSRQWNHDILSTGDPNSLRFFPCPGNPKLECTNLVVPKDYFNASAGTSTVALARYKATVPKAKSKGTIFINPGGPGGSGVYMATLWGEVLSTIVQGEYSIVGFDPRGIARSRPVVNCFPTKLHHQTFKLNTPLDRSFDLPPDPSSPEGYDSLLRQWASWRALYATQYQICGETMGEELKYMGTATVVRDIDYMAKVFDGKSAPIHYYGGSYGSILGAYLVNILPKRVGRVIIEGIANPVLWSNGPTTEWLRDWMVDTEKTYQWLLDDCVSAGPSLCALARENDTSSSIAKRIDNYLDALYYAPVPVTNHSRPGILTSGQARMTLYVATNAPARWPLIAQSFAQAMDGDATSLYSWYTRELALPPGPNLDGDTSRAAVSCADSVPEEKGADAKELVEMTLDVLANVTKRFALSGQSIEPDGACEFWPTKGREPERFTGPWNHTLPNGPMLIVSSLSDPITPLASARLINKLMSHSSRLIIQDTPGHGTSSAVGMSLCIAHTFRAYFANGTVPENEKHCKPDRKIFEPKGSEVGMQGLSSGDKELKEALERSALVWSAVKWPGMSM
ncbi:hypothetical protein EXIGLDRAFT_728593 [Exidia glandulosa HHB12029]|uniref:Uncharacterized protein n=1 Tax=Exidia glandulosa HHB12029 TaxID=1314781 RepID=A0A165Q4J2_EXIGL|nr:hypothetical protein EXIGLDRAFT_728593 [Exidia glandulosa HHB12029]